MTAKKGRTSEKIKKAGLRLFLENGFQKVTVLQISREVGISSQGFYKHFGGKEALFASLVEPVINRISGILRLEIDKKNKLISQKKQDKVWNKDEILSELTDYIYENFDSVRLLVCCADGSKYENITDRLAALEADTIIQNLPVLEQNGVELSRVDEQTLRLMIKHQYRLLTEFIRQGYSKDKADAFIRSVNEFYTVGWRAYFQF